MVNDTDKRRSKIIPDNLLETASSGLSDDESSHKLLPKKGPVSKKTAKTKETSSKQVYLICYNYITMCIIFHINI